MCSGLGKGVIWAETKKMLLIKKQNSRLLTYLLIKRIRKKTPFNSQVIKLYRIILLTFNIMDKSSRMSRRDRNR